jgi:adenylosuccinate lyase
VNPINFENLEGNIYLANSLLNMFSHKLPVSRLQRDLTDTTISRNFGSALSYCLIAYTSFIKGIDKL